MAQRTPRKSSQRPRRARLLSLERLEGRDLPSFLAPPAFPAGTNPAGLAGGDFNGDGRYDLAVADATGPGFVSALLNDGAGGFQAPHAFPAGSSATSVAVGDVNGNGTLDLVVTNQATGTLSVLRGSGTGLFRRPIAYTAGSAPTGVVLADFTGDGFADAAVVNGNQQISMLVNNGSGGFLPPASFTVGTDVKAVTTGDFNGDGLADVAAAGYQVQTCGDKPCPVNPRVSLFLSNGDGTFTAGATYVAYSSPGTVAAGDFNGDGVLDLVTADTHTGKKYEGLNVTVQIGNGDGTFQAPQYIGVAKTPAAVDVEDVDGDGILDVAVPLNTNSIQSLAYLRGRGDGTFFPTGFYDAGANAAAVAILDYTGDGVRDLAVLNAVTGTGTVTLLAGDGNGSFTAAPPLYGTGASSVAAADFTGDARPDFAATGTGASTDISVFAGGAGGGFQSVTQIPDGDGVRQLQAADYDGDGKPDLAISTSPEQTAGNISLALGTGGATAFEVAEKYPSVAESHGMAVGDFNGDGIPDLAVASGSIYGCCYHKLGVMLGTGTGGFGPATTYDTGHDAWSVQAADFNGDGIIDLATGWVVMLGKGNGSFFAPVLHGGQGCYVSVADFNHDGHEDLATNDCADVGNGFVRAVLGHGDGTFAPPAAYAIKDPWGINVGDFNGDGAVDLVDFEATYPNRPINVRLGNGDGTFQPPVVTVIPNVIPSHVCVGDLNEDGRADLLVSAQDNKAAFVLVGIGNGAFQAPLQIPLPFISQGATLADLNGDAHLDIGAARRSVDSFESPGQLAVLLGHGDGSFQNATVYVGDGSFIADAQVIAADLNGDGRPELMLSDSANGGVFVFRNLSDGTFAAVRAQKAPPGPGPLATGDFNGDGLPDVATAFTSSPYAVGVLLSAPNGTFGPPTSFPLNSVANGLTVADVNGDQVLDLIVTASGSVGVLLGKGDGTFQAAAYYPAGAGAFGVAVADFDGDGRPDLAVTNDQAVGTVSFLFGNGDGSFQAPLALPVGALPQAVLAGDFNNDGKPDVVVANSGGGTVTVLLGNGDGTFPKILTYAVANGLVDLAATDVNGDGFADLLVATADGVAVLLNDANWPPLPPSAGRHLGARVWAASGSASEDVPFVAALTPPAAPRSDRPADASAPIPAVARPASRLRPRPDPRAALRAVALDAGALAPAAGFDVPGR
jgi:hypothetical protein